MAAEPRLQYLTNWYGLGIRLQANHPGLIKRLQAVLPPGCSTGTRPANLLSYVLERDNSETETYTVYAEGTPVWRDADLGRLLQFLESHLQHSVAEQAPGHLFVHAGVVGWHGRAILLPGSSGSGKSELVRELIRAGAEYCSDEFAALDANAMVVPFARPISLRIAGGRQRIRPEDVNAATAERPLPIGLIAVTAFAPGSAFNPQLITPGQGLLELLRHTVAARTNPQRTITILKKAASGATAVRSSRGEAAETAKSLLNLLDQNLSERKMLS